MNMSFTSKETGTSRPIVTISTHFNTLSNEEKRKVLQEVQGWIVYEQSKILAEVKE